MRQRLRRPGRAGPVTGPKETALGIHANGTVDVRCWCEAEIVNVPLEVVRNGKTGSCKHGCDPSMISARAPAERRPQPRRRSRIARGQNGSEAAEPR
jgi:hypothetical protein